MKGYLSYNNSSAHGNPSLPTTSTSTSSRSTNPPQPTPLKRTRAKRSCDFCRKRKSRCDADGSIPCSNCKAWGYTCEFKTVRKKRGPPSVYVENLEKRCKKMEGLLATLTRLSINELEQNDFRLPKMPSTSTSGHSLIKETREDLEDEEYDGDYDEEDDEDEDFEDDNDHLDLEQHQSQLSVSDYDEITYTGRSASFKVIDPKIFNANPYISWPGRNDVLLHLTSQNELVVVRSGKRSDKRINIGISVRSSAIASSEDAGAMSRSVLLEASPGPSVGTTLADALTKKMIELYFSHLHPFLPIVNKAHFSTTDSPTILVHAILAVTLRFCSQYFPELLVKESSNHAQLYFDKVMKRLRYSFRSRLSHVQAAILLTLYLDLDNRDDVDSLQWYTLGTAIRMAQDLGLHRSCTHWNLPASEKETRHRVFYACYVLDRWLSARAGKPLTILDRDFDTDLPSLYELSDDTSEPSSRQPIYRSFILFISLSEILGRVLKALYAPKSKHANSNAGLEDSSILDVFDRRLKNWKESLDEPIDGIQVPAARKAYLEVFYYTIIVLLHRPFIEATPAYSQQEISKSKTTASKICSDAASVISHIIRQQRNQFNSDDPDAFFSLCLPTCFTYAMFQSSLIHLANVINDPSYDNNQMLEHSILLLKEHNHLVSAHQALSILDMLQFIYGLGASAPLDKKTLVAPSSAPTNATSMTKLLADQHTHQLMQQKSSQWFDSPIPSALPLFGHPQIITGAEGTNSATAAAAAAAAVAAASFDPLSGMPVSVCFNDPVWRGHNPIIEDHQYSLQPPIHHHPGTILGQLTDPPMQLPDHNVYHPSQPDIGYNLAGSKSSASSTHFYHHHHTSSLSSTSSSSSSSLLPTPHPTTLGPSSLNMSEWDMYIDQQQPQSQHQSYDMMPPHS